jgi:HD-GYP domain-containing protein (c-di-GMP phosphodiesterase class II)
VAEAYVNMTTERPFASARSSEQAIAEMEKCSGTQFDGLLVRLLSRQLKAEKSPSFGN